MQRKGPVERRHKSLLCGVEFFSLRRRREKGRVRSAIESSVLICYVLCIPLAELEFMRERDEQWKTLQVCHIDTTAGHVEEKKTIARISECFVWAGIFKDVKQMVLIE